MSPTHELMVGMHRRMLRIRRFEEMVAELSGHGEIGGAVHLTIGQEEAIIGACLALRPGD
jgi:pyruvate dehydrogenase E1 component alpha subunit